MSKYDKSINKLIIFIPFLFLFIDVLSSFLNIKFITISAIVRGIFLLLVIIYLYKNKINKKLLIIFSIYFVLELGYLFLFTKSNLLNEVINIFKLFYLPFLILFFSKIENKKMDDKYLFYIYLLIMLLTIVFRLIHINSLIIELYIILIGLFPICLNYVFYLKNYITKILFYIQILAIIILSNNIYVFGIYFLIFIFYYLRYLKLNFKELKTKEKINIIIFPLIILIIIGFYFINIKYKPINFNFNEIIAINKDYKTNNKYSIIYGLSNEEILKSGYIRNDLINILYSIGIFGIFIYFIMIISAFKNIRLRKQYKISFIIFIIICLISGHVLTKPLVSLFISLLIILNKNEVKIMKKRVLLVSNMYPSKKYKHYGSFVKNVKGVLEDGGYIVDKSVMYKQDNIISKIISYLSFYIGTIIKGLFNDYDYIYVHFISHSSFPAVFLKKTSKNVCLVLNAHGNDVVADLKIDEKNIKRSKKYIAYADKVVVPSNYYKSIMINNYNVDENKIYVYPSGGVDTDMFINKDMSLSKKECNLKEEYDYIGYVSRIEKNKGWDIFLKAIKLLKDEDKIGNTRFLIVGSGSEEKQMNDMMKELDIVYYIETRSLVSPQELVNIYNSLKIFVFPTYRESESLGLVGLEAMSCETFVIASDKYGPTDYVKNMKNGLLFKSGDYIDLKNKILDYEKLNNEQKRKIIKKSRETAIKYDVRNTKNEILKVFE